MIKTNIIFAILLLTGMCVACTSGVQSSPSSRSSDRSLANALYESENVFAHSQKSGDSVGMAKAARDRLEIVERLKRLSPEIDEMSPEAQQAYHRERAILDSARAMLAAAKLTADGDSDTLARIDRMFPGVRPAQSDPENPFNGIIGSPRKVELTIGLEMDATVVPGQPDVMRLPVAAITGTTIYIQPGGTFANAPVDLHLTVTPLVDGTRLNALACDRREVHGRLHCFLRAGEHTDVELRLENHGAEAVPVLIFVSGNATSVAAALAPE